MTQEPEILDKFLRDERRCTEIKRIIENMNFKPTSYVRDLIDEHIKNLRRKRKTWLEIYETEHPFHMGFLGVR